jgi:quinol monooxygenase YgiN
VPQIAIIVEYELHEGREAAFASLIKEHARRTLFEEDGCLRFEVLKPMDDAGKPIGNRMMVSELYADQTAVDLHRDNPRMAILRAAMDPLLKSRRLTLAKVVDEPEEEGLTPAELNASNDG